MKQIERGEPSGNRPRLALVIPLLLVCFGSIFILLYERLLRPASDTPATSGAEVPSYATSSEGKTLPKIRPLTDPISNKKPSAPIANRAGSAAIESKPADEEPSQTATQSGSSRESSGSIAGYQPIASGEIIGTITIKGTVPAPADWSGQINDPKCGRKEPLLSRVYVAGKNGELADVVVYIKDGLSGKRFEPSTEPVVIDQVGCEYLPYISAVQVKQKLLVKNSDQTMHNVNVQSKVSGNPVSNVAQIMGGKPLKYVFAKPEEFALFACNIHPWMKAYVSVFDHPFFAVSDTNGVFRIKNIPPGNYVIEANHRRAGKLSHEVTIQKGETHTVDFVLEIPLN